MRFEIFKATNDEFYFNIVSDNNKIVVTSQTYNQKSSAIQTINAIIDFFSKELTEFNYNKENNKSLIVDKTK